MDRPDNGVAVATSVQKVGLISWADGFFSLKFEDKKTLGLKLFQVWTNLTTVLLVEGKVRKPGLKLRIEKTNCGNAYMAAKILAKVWKNTFLDKFLKRKQKSKVCPEKVGLFQFKVGWFKTKAWTNLGPQNYMYLSAPGPPTSPLPWDAQSLILIVFSSTTMHFKAFVDKREQISKYFAIVGAENINKFPKVRVIAVIFRQILFT